MKNVYGYIYASVFHETGFTEKGAKVAASKCGSWGEDGITCWWGIVLT